MFNKSYCDLKVDLLCTFQLLDYTTVALHESQLIIILIYLILDFGAALLFILCLKRSCLSSSPCKPVVLRVVGHEQSACRVWTSKKLLRSMKENFS